MDQTKEAIQKKIDEEAFNVVIGEGKKEFPKVKIPANLYEAVCIDLAIISPGEYGERIAIRYEFMHNNEPIRLSVIGYKKISPASKMGKMLKTWLNIDLTPGANFDLRTVVGKKAVLFVKDFTNPEKETFSVIQDVLPYQQK